MGSFDDLMQSSNSAEDGSKFAKEGARENWVQQLLPNNCNTVAVSESARALQQTNPNNCNELALKLSARQIENAYSEPVKATEALKNADNLGRYLFENGRCRIELKDGSSITANADREAVRSEIGKLEWRYRVDCEETGRSAPVEKLLPFVQQITPLNPSNLSDKNFSLEHRARQSKDSGTLDLPNIYEELTKPAK